MPPSQCTSLPPLSPSLASSRCRQYQVALESALSMTPLLVLENGRALADKCPFVDGSRSGGCGWRTEAVGRRSRAGVKTQAQQCWRFSRHPKTWVLPSHSNMARAFHYVNSHPRGDPVSSLLNDYSMAEREGEERETLQTTCACTVRDMQYARATTKAAQERGAKHGCARARESS